jgi:hypothetical protein
MLVLVEPVHGDRHRVRAQPYEWNLTQSNFKEETNRASRAAGIVK